jgi:hypothetical protein
MPLILASGVVAEELSFARFIAAEDSKYLVRHYRRLSATGGLCVARPLFAYLSGLFFLDKAI